MSSKYTYVISEQAKNEISYCCFYLSSIVDNQGAVNDLYSRLYSTLDRICVYPYMYPNCRVYNILDEQVRHANIGSHVMIYQVDDSEFLIDVLHFFGKNQDISRIMGRDNYLC